jgi:hypothetical protein
MISLVTRRWNETIRDVPFSTTIRSYNSERAPHGFHLNVVHPAKYFWRCIRQQSKAQLGFVSEIGPVCVPALLHPIVCEKLHPFWAVTHHLSGHTRVHWQGFHRSTYPLSL